MSACAKMTERLNVADLSTGEYVAKKLAAKVEELKVSARSRRSQ
ncbi:MAG: hypothetical protein ACLRZH_16480 [Ruthenibacterium lactatiformans]